MKNNLKALRSAVGLSQDKLATAIGVKRKTVGCWENGKNTPQHRSLRKLKDIFQEDLKFGAQVKDNPESKKRKKEGDKEKETTIKHFFSVGKCYSLDTTSTSFLYNAVLRYEEKKGIHHVFREIHGNWIVTYTDAQLIGKKIVEVA